MKKMFLISVLILLFAGCAQQTVPVATNPNTTDTAITKPWPDDPSAIVEDGGFVWHTFRNEWFGVTFEYMDKFVYDKLFPVVMAGTSNQPTKIAFVELRQSDGTMYDDGYDQTIEIFTKPADQSIEDAIAGIITNNNGKDPSNCVLKDMTKDIEPLLETCIDTNCTTELPKRDFVAYYRIFPAKPIPYTADQQKQMAQGEDPNPPFDWKLKFDDENLVTACSTYAEKAGLGTSKSSPGYFIYSPEVNKTTFIFIPPSFDPAVHRNLNLLPSGRY